MKRSSSIAGWTLVRLVLEKGWHGLDRDYYSLVVRAVTDPEAKKVLKEGGVVFDDTNTALRATYKYCYSESGQSIMPHAERFGKFHPKLKIAGEPIYIPNETTPSNKAKLQH